ncbi:MAG: glycosyl hydrolase [Bryobacterales bacterium]|nr:glycosyl hydrolase [Bryobacterales bacterium]
MNISSPFAIFRGTNGFGVFLAIVLFSSVSAFGQQNPAPTDAAEKNAQPFFADLSYRNIGPMRGGRVTAVAGVPGDPMTYYFGATGGGVWKTTDGGVNWEAISDRDFKTGSVGAIAVAPSDPNVLYVGMGEAPIRGNVSHGDGVYKSTDAGKTWKNLGLKNTHQISRIRIHPRNPDIAYVAAQGHVWGSNEERGVYKTTDGGANWRLVKTQGPKAGATDLSMDAHNPEVLYAAFWEVYRTGWGMESGGEGSGLFKSSDGGETWQELTKADGLPKGPWGKLGVSVSPVNPNRVYALIEAEKGGLYRSDNAGRTWQLINDDVELRLRPWYYMRLYADPKDEHTVYITNVSFWRSDDAGVTFNTISVPHGDNQDLWIAPENNQRLLQANDGGANVSLNGGKTWTEQDQATAQFYRVTLDNDFPYNVYGAQQDNTTVRIASRNTHAGGIGERDWWPVGGGESGWIAPDPRDSNIVYAGSYMGMLTRYNHRTGETRVINVWPDYDLGHGAEDAKYRFQWNFPILISPHDPARLYTAANVLFLSTNEGQTWKPISPDLTRNDKSKMKSAGGLITKDNTGVEYYGTIFTVAESAVKSGVIWAGSDDGLIHITTDAAKTWKNVTPKAFPEWIRVNSIEASPFDAGTAYVAATMYQFDDFRPYLFKTADYGSTWTKIDNGIPADAFTRVIREDPNRKGLLYAGTELGMYVSFDDGQNWQSLQLDLPVVPITDLAVHKRDKDLVVATQGRSFWVLDDLPLLHQYAQDRQERDVHLFKPEDNYRVPGSRRRRRGGSNLGENPASGTVIYYWLKAEPKGELKLEFLNAKGETIQTFSSLDGKPQEPEVARKNPAGSAPDAQDGAPAKKGLNRFEWDLRYPNIEFFEGIILTDASYSGPRIIPGDYQVRLTVDGNSFTEKFSVKKDPRVKTTQEEFERQFSLLMQIYSKVNETNAALGRLRSVKAQLQEFSQRFQNEPRAKDLVSEAGQLVTRLGDVEQRLYQTNARTHEDNLNHPIRLNNKLATLIGFVDSSETQPTDQMQQAYEDLATRVNAELRTVNGLLDNDVKQFGEKVRNSNLPLFAAGGVE